MIEPFPGRHKDDVLGRRIDQNPSVRQGLIPMLPVLEITKPMEAKPVGDLPKGENWLYEPKWDGFRCLVYRDGKSVSLRSKRQLPFNRYFPELVAGILSIPAKKFVIDGEIVVETGGKVSFESLQLRLHPAERRVREISAKLPATLVAFDMLVDTKGRSLVKESLAVRRAALEDLLADVPDATRVRLSPATASPDVAIGWLKFAGQGLDGIMAKKLTSTYQPGVRAMCKYKRWHSIDGVIGGAFLAPSGVVEYLLLGLYDENGKLNYVGRIRPPAEKDLAARLKPLANGAGFDGKKPAEKNSWSRRRRAYLPLKPTLVAEVSADHVSGGHMRHGSRFVRWRKDKRPRDCSIEQVRR
jgi:ATP-dependent DNA ligase